MKTLAFTVIGTLLAGMQGAGGVGQVFDHQAQSAAYGSPAMSAPSTQCFNGSDLTGVDRGPDGALYVQSGGGAIFQLGLADPCPALLSASALTVRAGADLRVCAGAKADLVVATPQGERRCALQHVRRVTRAEAAKLAGAPR